PHLVVRSQRAASGALKSNRAPPGHSRSPDTSALPHLSCAHALSALGACAAARYGLRSGLVRETAFLRATPSTESPNRRVRSPTPSGRDRRVPTRACRQ